MEGVVFLGATGAAGKGARKTMPCRLGLSQWLLAAGVRIRGWGGGAAVGIDRDAFELDVRVAEAATHG